MKKLLYSTSKDTYDATLGSIQAKFPSYYRYLENNWVPHEALYAGFARKGILHFNNHTNNRLERYHHTIKAVLGTSQCSVGTLIDRLHKIVSVRSVSSQHASFNQRMKSLGNLPVAISSYEHCVTKFALDLIVEEYNRSLCINRDQIMDHGDGILFDIKGYSVSFLECTCDAFSSYHLPCRHIFFLRQEKFEPLFDMGLVTKRWIIANQPVNIASGQEQIVSGLIIDDIGKQYQSRAQRYNALATELLQIASQLSDLPRSTFVASMQWIETIKEKARSGLWQADISYQAASTSNNSNHMEHNVSIIDNSDYTAAAAEFDETSSSAFTLGVGVNALNVDETVDCAANLSDVIVDCLNGNDVLSALSYASNNEVLVTSENVSNGSSVQSVAQDAGATCSFPASLFNLPSKVKQRGRPAQVRQRTFAVKPKAKKITKAMLNDTKRQHEMPTTTFAHHNVASSVLSTVDVGNRNYPATASADGEGGQRVAASVSKTSNQSTNNIITDFTGTGALAIPKRTGGCRKDTVEPARDIRSNSVSVDNSQGSQPAVSASNNKSSTLRKCRPRTRITTTAGTLATSAPALRKSTEAPLRKRARCNNIKVDIGNSSDNCAECGLSEPANFSVLKRGKKKVQWIQCDICKYWYHVECLASKPIGIGGDWHCSRC